MIVPLCEIMPVIRAALKNGQRMRFTANGSSMIPFIHDGDVVELEPAKTLRLGDVTLVQTSEVEQYVIHRVVRMSGDSFFLRGDSQMHCEGPFSIGNHLGRVSTSWHRGRARAIDRGWWRLAGRMWMVVYPFGLWLLRMHWFVRRVGRWVLRRLQRIPVWASGRQ